MSKKLTKREKQIINTMNLDLETTKSITEIGRLCGTNKYDVWIGREISKNISLLNQQHNFQFIIDWAKKEKPDIFSLNFEEAMNASKEWHDNFKTTGKHRIFEEDKDEERVVYVSKNKKFFFMLLNPDELEIEGDIMKNCVSSYKSKLIKGQSLILSMRDNKNQPHVTIEVDVRTSSVTQVRGKANTPPSKEYMKIIAEFALYVSGYEDYSNKEIIDFLSKNNVTSYQVSKLNFFEQVYLFKNAKIIIGPHGAAFSNIIFSNPGLKIIELIPKNHPSIKCKEFSDLLGFEYTRVNLDLINNQHKDKKGDMKISIPHLSKILKNVL